MRKYTGDNRQGQLITVDIVCHGVGAPEIFRKYLDGLESKAGAQVTGFVFRNKKISWRNAFVNATFSDGKQYAKIALIDPMSVGFNRDVFLRESCYRCKYTDMRRISDITLSDFWGYKGNSEYPDDDRGVSMLLINTEVGKALLDQSRTALTLVEKTEEEAKKRPAAPDASDIKTG